MIKINQSDIIHSVGNASFDRGKAYYDQGFVKSVTIKEQNGSVLLEGVVSGQYKNNYKLHVTLTEDYESQVSIAGLCDCPVRYQCKHVAAVCLHYLDQIDDSNVEEKDAPTQFQRQCLQWLDSISHVESKIADSSPKSKDFLVYILKKGERDHSFGIEFCITHKRKNANGLVRGQTIQLRDFAHPYFSTPGFVEDIDVEIGRCLIACEGRGRQIELRSEIAHIALLKMLKTGRLYWHSTLNDPLSMGENRQLDLEWLSDNESGDATLQVSIQPDAEMILVDPPLYLDITGNKLGTIETELDCKQLTSLLKAPIIPPSLQDLVSRKIVKTFDKKVLPPIKEIKTEHLNEASIQPHLILFCHKSVNQERFYAVRLRFIYDDVEILSEPKQDVTTLEKEDRFIQVHRDIVQESEWSEMLYDLGLAPEYRFISTEDQFDQILSFNQTSGYVENISKWQWLISEKLPELQNQGWKVSLDESFNLEFYEAHEDWLAQIEEGESNTDWFELGFDLSINGIDSKIQLLPLVVKLLQEYERDQLPSKLLLEMEEGKFIQVVKEKITPVLDVLYELFDKVPLTDKGTIRLHSFDAARLDELQKNSALVLYWNGGDRLRSMGAKLNDFQGIENVMPPNGLKTELREYQQQGLNWLHFLRDFSFAGILADDMGLGKTVQTLAHLLLEKEQKRSTLPTLIIAPTSLMGNWRRETERFTPDLSVLILQGVNRSQLFKKIPDYDLVLSTYPLLSRDEHEILKYKYNYLILDEAQIIKNPKSKAAKVARMIKCDHRLCLTGTPMENHLGELWALFDFLMPGFLREERHFRKQFRIPIEKENDNDMRQRLNKRVAPFMVRRTKQQVASELPEKTEIIRTVELGTHQSALYESIRLSMEKKVRDMIYQKGLARSHITILDALLKLRQTCCHPALLSLEQARKVKESAKYTLLMEMVPEMVEEGRKILIFSQFRKMLEIIEKGLQENRIKYAMLTGQTRHREQEIDKFRLGHVDVFLVSLKAGGVGLNLTEADTVIHYDPWWNPAAEDQATDRAYRIGQDKPVFVYKLITENTVEEKIIAMQGKKKTLAEGIYSGKSKGSETALTADDLKELFSPL
jgi:SNF2 family DNA or RNA helicase